MGDDAERKRVKHYIGGVESDLSLLDDPSNSFLRVFVERAAAKVSASGDNSESKRTSVVMEEDKEELEDEEIIESDIECEGDTVEPDDDQPEHMGDSSAVVTEKHISLSEEAKTKAMRAASEEKFEEAIKELTDAIILNPFLSDLFEARAAVYIKMEKPNAAIRDAEAAIKMCRKSLEAYRSRGIARAMLGRWEEAARDIRAVLLIFADDEELKTILKKIEPNARKMEEHRKKYDKLLMEREYKLSRAEAKKDKMEEKASSSERTVTHRFSFGTTGLLHGFGVTGGNPGAGLPGGNPGAGLPGGYPGAGMPGGYPGAGMPGGYPGAGLPGGYLDSGMPGGYPGAGMPGGYPGAGMPGGYLDAGMPGGYPGAGLTGGYLDAGMTGGYAGAGLTGGYLDAGMPCGGKPAGVAVYKIFDDPELMAAVQDPQVMAALRDVVENASNLRKYQTHPKVAPLVTKMMSKVGRPKWPE